MGGKDPNPRRALQVPHLPHAHPPTQLGFLHLPCLSSAPASLTPTPSPLGFSPPTAPPSSLTFHPPLPHPHTCLSPSNSQLMRGHLRQATSRPSSSARIGGRGWEFDPIGSPGRGAVGQTGIPAKSRPNSIGLLTRPSRWKQFPPIHTSPFPYRNSLNSGLGPLSPTRSTLEETPTHTTPPPTPVLGMALCSGLDISDSQARVLTPGTSPDNRGGQSTELY